ncbi:bacteriocin-like protein [Chryseobacterium fluminis]|uniref:bacteriocin-like protein n=1 Tax=Chryseobacterium fluminis TaxID=2983606 RepID=UPI0038CBF93C
MKNLRKLSRGEMKNLNGGMKWTDDRCGNVIDRRRGAKPEWIQEIRNWWCSTFG